MSDYPAPPWHTHGNGFFASFRVPTSSIDLPAGFVAESVAGYSLGLLGFIEYQPPSPLCYRELLWLPTRVKAFGKRGHYVDKMYVDDARSLDAGRTEWALPKTMARFAVDQGQITMDGDDGSHVVLHGRGFGPRIPMPSQLARMATLQPEGDRLVRFRCSFAGSVRVARVRLDQLSAGASDWRSLEQARRLPFAASLDQFEATMHPPIRSA